MEVSQKLAAVVGRLRHVTYVDTIALAYNICDYAQTFEWEVSYMWGGRWTLVKIVYFIGRYLGLVDYPLKFIYNHVSGLTPNECDILFVVAACSALTGASFAEILMFLRVYVLSGCTKPMGRYLFIQFSVMLVIISAFAILYLKSLVYAASPMPGYINCYLLHSNRLHLSLMYVMVLVHQITVMVLSLYFGLKNFRHTTSPLLAILYRDGTIYFMVLSAVSITNLSVLTAGPPEYQNLFLMVQRCLHSTLSTRIILKMREMARRDVNYHSRNESTDLTGEELEFRATYPKFTSRQLEVIAEGPTISRHIPLFGGTTSRYRDVMEMETRTTIE